MIRCIALDDEPLALEIIKTFCQRVDHLLLETTFTNSISAKAYIENNKIDLLFCDIQMPEVNGIQFCAGLAYKPMIIFTTAFSEYAAQGYDVNAIDYLLKPFSFERFLIAANKAIDYYTYIIKQRDEDNEYIFVRSDYRMVKVKLNEIEYVEAMDDYIKIFCEGKRPIVSKMTMKKIEEELPVHRFRRIHRSYIVSIERIQSIKNKKVQIANIELPIGSKYELELERILKR